MSIPSGLETVKVELDEKNRIAKVILNRPEQLNTFNLVMRDDINHALRWASEDDRVRVVILTGAGRAFCAGADLSVNKADTFNSTTHKEGVDDHRDSGAQLSMAFFRCLKPVISVVNGPAVGIGATMILTTDIRIAVADARIGFVFAKRGITPEACSSFFLPRIVGPSKAAEWVYTGRIFKAGDEVNSGLFNYILPTKEAALQKAQEIALEISHNSSAVSVAISKKLFQSSFFYQPANPEDAHRLESRCIAYCGSKADAIEGVVSFLEKRPPQFTLKVSQDMPPVSWFPKVDIQPKSKL